MKKHLFALLLALCLIISLAVVVSAEEAEYTVTDTCGEHGTVEDSLFTAKAGETVTINVTADAGYHLDTTDTFTYSAEITDLSKRGNVVTFTMPECDVTVDLAMEGNYYELWHNESGGSVTVEPSSFRTGEIVTITVTPDPGYEFTGYSENLKQFTGVMDIPPEGGSWTFTVPELFLGSSAVGVTVNFFFEPASSDPSDSPAASAFTDVQAGQFYYDAVLWAVENEVTKGATSTTFAPGNNCTRGQIVTFLYRTMAEE